VSMIEVGDSSIHRTGKEESSSSSKKAANFDLVLSMTVEALKNESQEAQLMASDQVTLHVKFTRATERYK
jgi:hypothetical protein